MELPESIQFYISTSTGFCCIDMCALFKIPIALFAVFSISKRFVYARIKRPAEHVWFVNLLLIEIMNERNMNEKQKKKIKLYEMQQFSIEKQENRMNRKR